MSNEKEIPIQKYVIYLLAIITSFFIILRVILYFSDILPWIKETKDIDFKILIEGMDNGLANFYDDVTISDWPPYYLYFWYFLFLPVKIISINGVVGVYVWDVLRLVLTILIILRLFQLTKPFC